VKTILIVDDDECFREMLRLSLENCGFNVRVAESAGEALELVACCGIDAVLTDYQMPQTNGLQLCRALRDQDRTFDRRLPVWVMTGSNALAADEAIAAGALGLFAKPFRTSEVAQILKTALLADAANANVAP
jgi:CheY-like chemotaxis protein